MANDLDPTAWLACVERLLAVPCAAWDHRELAQASRLLATGMVLMRCRQRHDADVPGRIVGRAQCLARCAEELFRDVIDATPSTIGERVQCPWCHGVPGNRVNT